MVVQEQPLRGEQGCLVQVKIVEPQTVIQRHSVDVGAQVRSFHEPWTPSSNKLDQVEPVHPRIAISAAGQIKEPPDSLHGGVVNLKQWKSD